MKHYRPYLIGFVVYCAILFISPHVYAHFHFEPRHPVDFYLDEKREWERSHGIQDPFKSYGEWLNDQNQKESNFWREFGEGCAYSFDPWYSPAEANDQHGRD